MGHRFRGNAERQRILAFQGTTTTGNISATSDQLTVASAAGFTIGDSIIVAVGGESGAGMRGTKGVGGTWPALSYATTVAMNADSGQANNTFAWVEATGTVYRYVGGVWGAYTTNPYYGEKAVPKALVTTITGIAGNVLTLDDAATVTTTDADVYFDNLPLFDAAVALGGTHITILIGGGSFAISGEFFLLNKPYWQIRGAGPALTEVFVPPGVFHAGLCRIYTGSSGCTVRDIHFRDNFLTDGFGLSTTVTETDFPQGSAYPHGVKFVLLDGGAIYNVKVTDVAQQAFCISTGSDLWVRNCTCVHTVARQSYIQWDFQVADSVDSGFVDCHVDSPYLVAGFESFRSLNVQMLRCTSRNGVVACNSSGDFLIEDFELTIEEDSQFSEVSFSKNGICIDINANIGTDPYLAFGGTLRNITITHEGYINADNDQLYGIVINTTNPDIVIDGGTYTGLNWASPSTLNGPVGINSVGTNTDVSDFTVIGTPKSGTFNIIVTDGSITNCTAEQIDGP